MSVAELSVEVELTADGYLRLPGEFCREHFPEDRAAGLRKADRLVLMPATIYAQNGMIIKQRNLAGERSVLVREVWGDDLPIGPVTASWLPRRRQFVIRLEAEGAEA